MKKLLTAFAFTIASACSYATPVDLSSWSEEGGGDWTVAGDTHSVFQRVNTALPAVFYNNTNSQGLALSGQITVETTGDDDFIGFVLGYNTGDSSNANADYLLIDWKQNNQQVGSYGNRGLAISRVTGEFNFSDFWGHENVVEELQRGANLGDAGWVDNETYDFDLIFNSTNVQVFVNGVLEINISGTFADGSFGFYNLSQGSVRYAGIEEEIAPPAVPAPGVLLLMGLGLGIMSIVRRKA